MHAGNGQLHQKEKSRQLQRRLYLAAKKSRNRRFHALYDRIIRPDVLWRAWEEVKANGGSAGVDGVRLEEVERQGVALFLEAIAGDLKAGRYKPQPVLRVYIPKPDGRQRPLGIPTVRDRVVQQACRIVIEPIFEANFQDHSYGFRPKHSAAQAVRAVDKVLKRGWWVVDADIQGYFDAIDHDLLLTLVKRRVSDRRVLKLLCQWLKAGVMEEGQWRATELGSPQGGVISPLMANIYLHVLDMYWTKQYSELGTLFRYADDFVVVCRSKTAAERALELIRQIMEKLKLTLHPTKTRLVDLGREGFEFLGFHFHKRTDRRTGKMLPYFWPGQKAMKTVRSKLRQLTGYSRKRVPMAKIVNDLNLVIRGWRNYFSVGNSTKQLKALDHYAWLRIRRSFLARQGNRGDSLRARFPAWLACCGVEHFYKPGLCGIGFERSRRTDNR
jgi:group II intron reverse transcriptase/maturase